MSAQFHSEPQISARIESNSQNAPGGAKDAFDALMVSLRSFIAEGEVTVPPAQSERTKFGLGSGVSSFLNTFRKGSQYNVSDFSVSLDGDYDPVLPPELIKSAPAHPAVRYHAR